MSDPADKLLSEALKLTPAERARIAVELIASVDGEPDVDAKAAWESEIEQRVRKIRELGATGDEWGEIRARIASRLRQK